MIKINCQYSDRNSLCKNVKVKRGLFGFGARVCVEYGTNKRCEFKRPYPKPPAPPPPPPKRMIREGVRIVTFPEKDGKSEEINEGLILYCRACRGIIRNPGALLFSPPKGVIVEKYHFCHRCYNIIISSIETGELFFGGNGEE